MITYTGDGRWKMVQIMAGIMSGMLEIIPMEILKSWTRKHMCFDN